MYVFKARVVDRRGEEHRLAHAEATMCTCLLDEEGKASLRISQAIDRELSQFKKENAREFKLLLLGLFPVAQRDKR